jgi:hypothetical protein
MWIAYADGMKSSSQGLWSLARRARAYATDIRHPASVVAGRREGRALRRDYPGLATDLSGRSRADGRRYVIVSLNPRPRQIRLEALLAKSLQLRGAQVNVLTFRSIPGAIRAWRSLGFGDLLFYEDFVPRSASTTGIVDATFETCRTVRDYKEYEYRGVRVGRQALATVVRFRHEPRVDLDDPVVRQELARTLGYGLEGVHVGERLFEQRRPDALLMIERGYAGLGAFSDVALQRGIEVVQFGSAHRDDAFLLKRYDLANRDLHPRSLDDHTWSRLLEGGWTEERETALEQELSSREQAKWFIARHARHSARRRGPDALRRDLGLDPRRKTAVLFSHVLWDAAMFYGQDVFDDQGQWFEQTLRLAAEDDRVQWLVKLHPALFWKLEQDGVRREPAELAMIREAVGDLPEHMRLIQPDDDVDNVDLFQIVDVGVTIRGTVGLELPRLGIPVLTAGTSDYAGRGFTIDATDREAYARNVRAIAELERLDAEQIRLANLYAYGVFCVRPWRFTSFTLDYLPPDQSGEALDHQLRFHVRTIDDLERAEDLRAFASWADGSEDRDFVDERAFDLAERAPAL